MKVLVAVVMVLAMVSFGSVRSGSLHRSDAVTLSDALASVGVQSDVSIMRNDGGKHFVAYFSGNYDVDEDIYEVIVLAMAAGEISRQTSWTSSLAIAVFRDKVVGISTANCREIVRMVNAGYSDVVVLEFYLRNSYAIPRSESAF